VSGGGSDDTGLAGASEPPFISVPIVLVALLRLSRFSVTLSHDGEGGACWRFRFSPDDLLEVRDDGHWHWECNTDAGLRAKVETIVAEAQALLARTRH
jgi:hypothetical protein